MPHSRRRPRIAPNGRVSIRLTPPQRDLLLQSAETPKALGHALHRAPVRQGKLSVRLDRESLDALIASASRTRVPDRKLERELSTFLRYLEGVADRFAEPEEQSEVAPRGEEPPSETAV